VRYDNWEELGSLPPYNAVWARTQSKTGDMKQANGGTPPSKRYKGRRDFHSSVHCLLHLLRIALLFSWSAPCQAQAWTHRRSDVQQSSCTALRCALRSGTAIPTCGATMLSAPDGPAGGRLDEPEDRLIPKVIGSESVGDSASSLPTQKKKSGPGFFSRISGHTGGDKVRDPSHCHVLMP
jgi:hypothetical protein